MRPNSCECWCDWIIIWIRLETHKYRRPLPLVSAKQPRSLQLYDISQTGVLRWALAFYILTYRRQWLSHMLQWRPLLIHLLSCTNRRGQPRSLHISLRKTYCLHTLCSYISCVIGILEEVKVICWGLNNTTAKHLRVWSIINKNPQNNYHDKQTIIA